MAWKENFLNSVSQIVFGEAVNELHEPICHDLNAKVENLKKKVVSQTHLDPYELPNIPLDVIYDTENESEYLLKIKQGMDTLAGLPIGQSILSGIRYNTHFCALPLSNKFLGRFCVDATPYVILNISDQVFNDSDTILKVLTHELTHANNDEIQENIQNTCFYLLPPKLYFMGRIFNELSARFNEKIVLAQKNGQQADSTIISQEDVFETLCQIDHQGYLTEFAHKTVKLCDDMEKIIVSPDLTEKNLKISAYYMRTYPVLRSLALIGEIERLYDERVMPIAQNKWPELKGVIQSKKSMER